MNVEKEFEKLREEWDRSGIYDDNKGLMTNTQRKRRDDFLWR